MSFSMAFEGRGLESGDARSSGGVFSLSDDFGVWRDWAGTAFAPADASIAVGMVDSTKDGSAAIGALLLTCESVAEVCSADS